MTTSVSAAQIYFEPVAYMLLHIDGIIEKGDFRKFQLKVNEQKRLVESDGSIYTGVSLHLNSQGGSVEEAIAIGRLVRENEMMTVVDKYMKCFSACIFVHIAGVNRFSIGSIGIHRPYFYNIEGGLSTSQVRAKIEFLNNKIKDYLIEMDIPLSLLDAMRSVPPDSMKILNYDEIDLYRIDGEDATYDEREVSKGASERGITSSEYRKRLASLDDACGGKISQIPFALRSKYRECREAHLFGLSFDEYKRRQSSLYRQCLKLKGERLNECERKIMIK